jgi:uncharacterized protein DUF3489
MNTERDNPHTSRPASKLSDTQLMLLSAAAQRDDLCLTPRPNLKGGASHKVAEKLITLGFVEEIAAKAGAPIWRRDEENQAYALKVTMAGLKAISIDLTEREDPTGDLDAKGGTDRSGVAATASPAGHELAAESLDDRDREETRVESAESETSRAAPRAGTKLAEVIDLLSREQGATIAELIAATNWLSHTTRAALTGLRKRGYEIERVRSDRITSYRISNALSAVPVASGSANEGVGDSATEHEAA